LNKKKIAKAINKKKKLKRKLSPKIGLMMKRFFNYGKTINAHLEPARSSKKEYVSLYKRAWVFLAIDLML